MNFKDALDEPLIGKSPSRTPHTWGSSFIFRVQLFDEQLKIIIFVHLWSETCDLDGKIDKGYSDQIQREKISPSRPACSKWPGILSQLPHLAPFWLAYYLQRKWLLRNGRSNVRELIQNSATWIQQDLGFKSKISGWVEGTFPEPMFNLLGVVTLTLQRWRNGDSHIPEAHWPATLAYLVSAKPKRDPVSEGKKKSTWLLRTNT